MAIDWTKPVRTVGDHQPMTVLTTERPGGGAPVVVMHNETGAFCFYAPDGAPWGSDMPMIENVPEKHVAWLNIYGERSTFLYSTRIAADNALSRDKRTACIRVEYEEGEGL